MYKYHLIKIVRLSITVGMIFLYLFLEFFILGPEMRMQWDESGSPLGFISLIFIGMASTPLANSLALAIVGDTAKKEPSNEA